MAQTRRRRRTKHRGNAAGVVEARGRTGRKPTAAEKGGAHCIALNAADEVAVEAFLERKIPFTGIAGTIEKVLASMPGSHPATIEEVLASDREAREMARTFLV